MPNVSRTYATPRRRGASRGPLLLLIGTPGTGKRPLGSYLEREHGFVHLNFENAETRAEYLGRGGASLRARIDELRAGGRGVVITWAAGDAAQLHEVRRLLSQGAAAIWTDSDRGAACRAHYAGARRIPRFDFVDTFEADGSFRPIEAVVGQLLEHRPRRRTPQRPSLPRVRIVGDLRFRLMAAASALAGAATATAIVLTGIGAATSGGGHHATPALGLGGPARATSAPALPRQGVLVSNQSLAGIRLGDSRATVKKLWGGRFSRCGGCTPETWIYFYPPPADPAGAGVEFERGKVVAVFTLGSPTGWRTSNGIKVGQILGFPHANDPQWLSCNGYSAKPATRSGSAVASILTQGAAVYGFALTRPSVSPCH
jgi:hypothetical protein